MKTKEVLNSILSRFERGDIPEIVAFSMFTCPDIPSSKWSLLNRTIQFINGTNDARGFRQWQRVNRHVVKGAKAFFILAPLTGKVEKDGEEQTVLKGFKGVPVFRVEDTEGEPLEHDKIELPEFPLLQRAKEWGITVRAVPAADKTYGYYSPGSHEIGLATDEEQVFFHELAHAAHGIVKGRLETGQDWRQEIVAELSAASYATVEGALRASGGRRAAGGSVRGGAQEPGLTGGGLLPGSLPPRRREHHLLLPGRLLLAAPPA